MAFLQYAEELDEKAAGLEAQTSQDASRLLAQPVGTYRQEQVQQQQSKDPAPDPSEPKTKA